jgi:ABC-type branched-subunit amino acid transport system ATPase component
MLEVTGLRAGYGRIPILAGIAFRIVPGEIVGVLGHNGMGKTTLIRTLMGFLPATAGAIRFRDRDITGVPTHARARLGLGYVPQGRQIFPHLTVRDNLRFAARGGDPALLERALSDFPTLTRLLDRPGGALSGGEQQLLAIARALCAEPHLLLLDEPTEGIQPLVIEQIAAALDVLNGERGLALLIVEQNLDFIARLARRVLILQKGEIARELAPAELRADRILEEFAGIAAEDEHREAQSTRTGP